MASSKPPPGFPCSYGQGDVQGQLEPTGGVSSHALDPSTALRYVRLGRGDILHILMVTNTFVPHVGGVARSVQRFTETYQQLWQDVTVIAPGVPGQEVQESGVVRIPAFGNINNSSFSLPSLTGRLEKALTLTSAIQRPDVIHSHHPFLLGELARRLSDKLKVPLVFTHHTMYEQYAYAAGSVANSSFTPRFIAQLATKYANNCDRVIAPSESTRDILRSRGVVSPIDIVPTGVDVEKFGRGNKSFWRTKLAVPMDAPVLGYVGRLAPEKNLEFLVDAGLRALDQNPKAHFIVVGDGPAADDVKRAFRNKRVHLLGSRQGQELVDAYHAMDVFCFSSKSETQGMVLVEAMAAGAPVVALDASGSRDVVVDGVNGKLVKEETPAALAAGFLWALENRPSLQHGARKTAVDFSQRSCANRALDVYRNARFSSKKLRHAMSLVTRVFG